MVKRLPFITQSVISLVTPCGKSIQLSETALCLVVELLQMLSLFDRAASGRNRTDQGSGFVVDDQVIGDDVVEKWESLSQPRVSVQQFSQGRSVTEIQALLRRIVNIKVALRDVYTSALTP